MIEAVTAFVLGFFVGFIGLDWWSYERGRKKTTATRPTCRNYGCEAYQDLRCGSGHCTHHCDLWCHKACLDPRRVQLGVMDGGKKK